MKENNLIYFAKMRVDALIPKKKDEDAGYDLYAAFDEDLIIINPHKTGLIPTGIAWASSSDFYMQIEERSSTGSKGIKTSGGIIDSGYRGEIKVAIYNTNDIPLIFSPKSEEDVNEILKKKGIFLDNYIYYSTSKAIAQGILHRVEKMEIKEISLEALQSIPSIRGDKGWGSSNIKDEFDLIKKSLNKINGDKNE